MLPARAALVAVPALCVVPATYALLRFWDLATGVQLDPAIAPPSPDIAMFWRLGVGAVIALGLLGPLARFAEIAPARALRVAELAVLGSAAMLVIQAALAP